MKIQLYKVEKVSGEISYEVRNNITLESYYTEKEARRRIKELQDMQTKKEELLEEIEL